MTIKFAASPINTTFRSKSRLVGSEIG
jgi:hypothetical protein